MLHSVNTSQNRLSSVESERETSTNASGSIIDLAGVSLPAMLPSVAHCLHATVDAASRALSAT